MITTLVIGIMTGIVVCIPPGPISVTCIRYGLLGRTRDGTLIVLGATSIDIVSALVSVFASSVIVSWLHTFIASHTELVTVVQVACVAVLAFLGIRYLKNKPAPQPQSPEKPPPTTLHWFRRSGSHLLMGVGIAFTSMIAPTFFPSMFFITGFLHSNNIIADGTAPNLMFGLGFGIGAFIWLSSLLHSVNLFRNRLSANFLKYVYRFAGGAFIVFAAVLAYKVLVQLGISLPVTRATQTLVR